MKLSFYLFRAEVTEFEDALRATYLGGRSPFVEIAPSHALGFDCKAFIQVAKEKPPAWAKFLATAFALDDFDLVNASNSFVLLVKVEGRLFGVTFGYGYNALDRAKIEPGFGLRVVLNAVAPDRVRSLESRTLDAVARQARVQISSGGTVGRFGVNTNQDWVRYLSGRPVDLAIGKNVSGADALSLVYDASMVNLGEKCRELIACYRSEAYRVAFPFIDHLRPLDKHDPAIEQLNTRLREAVVAQSRDVLTIAPPEILDDERVHSYVLQFRGESRDVDDITLDVIFDLLDGVAPEHVDPSKVAVLGQDDGGNPATGKRSLSDYLSAEFEVDDTVYVHASGRWFRAAREYVTRLREEASRLSDLTDHLRLPAIRHGEGEGPYNERVAQIKGWASFDREFFRPGGQNMEICDIVTQDRDFIHVKKMTSSAPLSHLFGQGTVSAIFLNESAAHREAVATALLERFPGRDFQGLRQVRVVYAIATTKPGPLASSIFLFSLVNLLEHAQTIRRAGHDVALCKISYEPLPV